MSLGAPTPALTALRSRVASGPEPAAAEVRKSVLERLDDLIAALRAADAALVADTYDATDVAAQKLVFCHWVSGSAWRRYLIGLGEFGAGERIAAALAHDIQSPAGEIGRRLAGRATTAVSRRDGCNALACAVCGRDAVTFAATESGLACSTLSPVNAGPVCRGETGARLDALLAAGDGRAALELLTGPGGPGCNAYCAPCERVYCKDHYAVETKWSGSWHESTSATCPLGHAREFE